jgi:hypothetical protein
VTVADSAQLGSSMSVAGNKQLMDSLSVVGALVVLEAGGSATFKRSLSVMSFVSFTDAMTVAGASWLGSDLSVFDFVQLGSKLPQY